MAQGNEKDALTRAGLISMVAKKTGLPKDTARIVVLSMFGAMSDAIIARKSITVRGFGSFLIRDRPGKDALQPNTTIQIRIPPRRLPIFIASKAIKSRINDAYLAEVAARGNTH